MTHGEYMAVDYVDLDENVNYPSHDRSKPSVGRYP